MNEGSDLPKKVGDKLSKWILGASPELGPIRSNRNETGKILCSYTTRPSPSDTWFQTTLANLASLPTSARGSDGAVDISAKEDQVFRRNLSRDR